MKTSQSGTKPLHRPGRFILPFLVMASSLALLANQAEGAVIYTAADPSDGSHFLDLNGLSGNYITVPSHATQIVIQFTLTALTANPNGQLDFGVKLDESQSDMQRAIHNAKPTLRIAFGGDDTLQIRSHSGAWQDEEILPEKLFSGVGSEATVILTLGLTDGKFSQNDIFLMEVWQGSDTSGTPYSVSATRTATGTAWTDDQVSLGITKPAGVGVSGVTVSVIPEPSGVVLAVVGVGLLFARRRRA